MHRTLRLGRRQIRIAACKAAQLGLQSRAEAPEPVIEALRLVDLDMQSIAVSSEAGADFHMTQANLGFAGPVCVGKRALRTQRQGQGLM